MILLFYPLFFLGVLAFLFFYWQKLKEDYTQDEIFSSGFLIIFGAILGFIIFNRWLPSFSFWGFFAGGVLFGLYAVSKMNLKGYEVWDGAGLGFVWLTLFSSLAGKEEDFLSILPALVSLVVYFLFLKNYRKFSWYPSGKIGFIAGSLGVVYFFVRGIVAIYKFWVLSFLSSIWDLGLSLLGCIVFACIVYSRSGRKFRFGMKH